MWFANFASIGIQIGGIGAIAPTRTKDLKLGILALLLELLHVYLHKHRWNNNLNYEAISYLIDRVMKEGSVKNDRTVPAQSIFGHQMRFDLSKGFPCITTKKLHLKSLS